MNRHLTIALSWVVASSATLFAIPTNIGGFDFLDGMRLEDFALSAEAWSADELVGDWEQEPAGKGKSAEDIYRLKKDVTVFGVKADGVDALKSQGELDRFLIAYRPGKKTITTCAELIRILRRNIEAYTGSTFVAAAAADQATPPGYRCRYKGFEIHLGKGSSDQVLVVILRAPA